MSTPTYGELKALIEGMGYEVEEGEFVRRDGTSSNVRILPRDAERIARHVVWAFDRAFVEAIEPAEGTGT